MNDHETIREALAQLDPENDGHWTSQALPRMDVLEAMGLKIERRELNEAMPGFNRTKARESRSVAPAQAPAAAPSGQRDPTYEELCSEHLVVRARRRQAALEHLESGGFTLKDLEPVRSRLEQRLGAQNRAARRALASH